RRAPARRTGHEVRDAAVALPPVLVRLGEPADDHRDAIRPGWIRYVPELVRAGAERAQQVDLALVGARQFAAVADADHLRAAVFGHPPLAGNVGGGARLL